MLILYKNDRNVRFVLYLFTKTSNSNNLHPTEVLKQLTLFQGLDYKQGVSKKSDGILWQKVSFSTISILSMAQNEISPNEVPTCSCKTPCVQACIAGKSLDVPINSTNTSHKRKERGGNIFPRQVPLGKSFHSLIFLLA